MHRRHLIGFCTATILTPLVSGCSDRPPPLALGSNAPRQSSAADAEPTTPMPPSTAPQPTAPVDPVTITPKGHPKEWWEAVYAYGTKIGWGHFDITNFEENGRKLAQIDNQNHIAVDREGQRTTIDISTRGVESPEGELLRFRTEMNSGNEPHRNGRPRCRRTIDDRNHHPRQNHDRSVSLDCRHAGL